MCGLEDAALPVAGSAFFYLVQYDDGVPRGYGADSAPAPRGHDPGGAACN